MATDLPRLAYGIDEFAEKIGHPRSGVYALIRDGKLRTFKIGRRRYVSADAARELIEKLESEAEPAR